MLHEFTDDNNSRHVLRHSRNLVMGDCGGLGWQYARGVIMVRSVLLECFLQSNTDPSLYETHLQSHTGTIDTTGARGCWACEPSRVK